MNLARTSLILFCAFLFCRDVSPSEANPLRNLEIGAAAFPFSLTDTKGNAVTLEKHKGKPVVVCYWREGQSFSEKMLKVLVQAHSRFSGKGVEFISITGRDEGASGMPKADLPFPVLLDDKREVYGSYGLFILPTTFVLDKEHRLNSYFSSYQDGVDAELESALSKILGLKEPVKEPPRYGVSQGIEDPRLNLARRLLEEGKAEEALPVLEEGLKGPASKDISELKILSAQALLQLSKPDEARARLEDCLKETPSSRQAILLMGKTLTLLGRYVPAEEFLKKALVLSPHSEKAHYYLGELYEKTGRKDQALAEYRLALERVFGR